MLRHDSAYSVIRDVVAKGSLADASEIQHNANKPGEKIISAVDNRK
jgi:hypothetical protein